MEFSITFIYFDREGNFHPISYYGITICTAVEYNVLAATRKRLINGRVTYEYIVKMWIWDFLISMWVSCATIMCLIIGTGCVCCTSATIKPLIYYSKSYVLFNHGNQHILFNTTQSYNPYRIGDCISHMHV